MVTHANIAAAVPARCDRISRNKRRIALVASGGSFAAQALVSTGSLTVQSCVLLARTQLLDAVKARNKTAGNDHRIDVEPIRS